jgi:hypothetical protein
MQVGAADRAGVEFGWEPAGLVAEHTLEAVTRTCCAAVQARTPQQCSDSRSACGKATACMCAAWMFLTAVDEHKSEDHKHMATFAPWLSFVLA